MKPTKRFVSLFAGIGGVDLGWERAGWECVGQIEVEPYCRDVLHRHWPHLWRRGDIRLVRPDMLPAHDALIGGFPCQDVSVAGKQAGIHGRRSGLWFEFLRLVQGVRPHWVVIENVPGLRTAGADTVLSGLEAAGYACWPLVVGARHVGAPHRRDRVWIVAHRPEPGLEGEGEGLPRPRRDGLADPERSVLRHEPGRSCGAGGTSAAELGTHDVAHSHSHGCEGERRGGLLDGLGETQRDNPDGCYRWPARPGEPQHEWEPPRTIEPRVGRMSDGVSRRLALKAFGNSVVPQVAEVIGRAIGQTAIETVRINAVDEALRTLRSQLAAMEVPE